MRGSGRGREGVSELSPMRPRPACRVCRRVGCTDPSHKPKPFAKAETTAERRPEYRSYAQQKRRRATVNAWLSMHEVGRTEQGKRVAVCPDCQQLRCAWIADHVVPVMDGGSEDGALRVHCLSCSRSQGARVGHKRSRN